MRGTLRRWLVLALPFCVLLTFTLAPRSATAAPPRATAPAYTIAYSLSGNPLDYTYTASYTPTVPAIYAWAFVLSHGNAPDKTVKVDAQFVSPSGQKVTTQWYDKDNGQVASMPEDTFLNATSVPVKNLSRRQLNVNGTANQALTGVWTINFLLDGKIQQTTTFTLLDENQASARMGLEDAGYTVKDFGETTWDDGTVCAYALMSMASTDLYSSVIGKQLVDGFTALRQGFTDANVLSTNLEYSSQYLIIYRTTSDDFDKYSKSKDFNALMKATSLNVWDRQAGDWLQSSDQKDFINKNFGAGNYTPPTGTSSSTTSSVGAIKLQVIPSELPADGTSTAQVVATVLDLKNKPLANTAVVFAVNGDGSGIVKPRSVATNAKGQATTTFTAGSQPGSMTLTATVGKKSAVTTLTLDDASGGTITPTDDAETAVRTVMESQGYTVVNVLSDTTKSLASVEVDPGADFDINSVGQPIVLGMLVLRDSYPDAKNYGVLVVFQTKYILSFTASAAEIDQMGSKIQAANGDKTKIQTATSAFLKTVLLRGVVLDATTGKQVSGFKDFFNKNFGGG